MKSLKISFFLFMLFSLAFIACKKEDTLTATNFTATLTGISNGQVVGTVAAEASSGDAITYTISNQNVAGALAINASTGQLTIPLDQTVFDAYCSPTPVTTLTATVTTTSGDLTTTCTVSILLTLGGC